jgi:hypothetical protein
MAQKSRQSVDWFQPLWWPDLVLRTTNLATGEWKHGTLPFKPTDSYELVSDPAVQSLVITVPLVFRFQSFGLRQRN